jgi:hypothetical protein
LNIPFAPTSQKARAPIGAAMAAVVVVWLLLTQISAIQKSYLYGLSDTADPYSEANVIRAAEHYAKYGFSVDAGLAHIVYGERFPNAGWVKHLHRYPLPSGVYTRYPPLPEIICGFLEKLIGYHVWAWRLVPVFFGLVATAYAFVALRRVLDPVVAGVMIILLSIVPMATSHMHGLHFHSYAHAAFLAQLALLVRIFFSPERTSVASYAVLFALGFLQGWLSFEYAFVVAGAAVPLALVAHANKSPVEVRKTLLIALLTGAGFTIAHMLHFLQVAAFYGSVSMALQDLSGRALYRFAGDIQTSYLVQVATNLVKYLKVLWFSPNNHHFGAMLVIFSIMVFLDRIIALKESGEPSAPARRYLALVSDRSVILPVLLSYGIAALWLLVMPSHADIHTHIVPRIFFLPYFVLVLVFMLRIFEHPFATRCGTSMK